MNAGDGRPDYFLERTTHARNMFQMALYAAHLATGETVLCKAIKSGTILGYLKDVVAFISRGRMLNGTALCDPRRENPTDAHFCKPIMDVINEVRRWEGQPDRREPFTIDMWKYIAAEASSQHADTLLPALRDWFGAGLYGGFRKSEWAQDPSAGDPTTSTPLLNAFGDPYAFCLDDVSFYIRQRTPFYHHMLKDPHARGSIRRATLRYRQQKNGQNGEVTTFHDTEAVTELSAVQLLVSIVCRFIRLVGLLSNVPLAVYKDRHHRVRRVTSNEIETVMRGAASVVYSLHPSKHRAALQKWSAHSIRVGACQILYAKGFAEHQIQHLLRWRSTSFMHYLRHISFVSARQAAAVADLAEMPNFL